MDPSTLRRFIPNARRICTESEPAPQGAMGEKRNVKVTNMCVKVNIKNEVGKMY
jgi:hypothetical protein